jgi:hypothetical protein
MTITTVKPPISVKEMILRVGKLIDSEKYKQVKGQLATKDCERCYLGLVAQVLVDEGYYKWVPSTYCKSVYLKATPAGHKAGISWYYYRTLLCKIVPFFDQHNYSYQQIHAEVKKKTS